jgi:hypothetical protein
MSGVVIQIGENRVAYDGHEWTPVSGERSELLVIICALKSAYISMMPPAIVISPTPSLKPRPRISEEKLVSVSQTRLLRRLESC